MPGYEVAQAHFKNRQFLDRYSCISCKLLLRDAVQSALCGHWFCESCISLLLKNYENPKCPSCAEGLKPEEEGSNYFPDKFARRDINALEMECVYKNDGCTWEGNFGKFEAHLASCKYSVCEACCQRLTTVPSEHRCTLKGKIKDEGHPTGSEEDLLCPLVIIGCSAKEFATRQDLEAHMRDSEIAHHDLLVTSITKLEINRMVDKPHQCTDKRDTSFESSKPVKAEYIGNTSIAQEAGQTSSLMSNDQTMTNDVQMQLHKMKEEVNAVRKELRDKDERIASLRAVIDKLERNQRSQGFEDRDFRLSLIENSNCNGAMVWKIPQFSQRMTDTQSGKYTSIFSLPFYTGQNGYKMCLRLYILGDGIGKGSYMSLFFVLMKGEFDNILQWPFTHKVTFKLLNQGNGRDIVDTFQPDPMSTSFRKPKSDMNIASGCPRFVSHEDLKSGGFILEDTVFIKCIVDTNVAELLVDDTVFVL